MENFGIIQRHEMVDIEWNPPPEGWFKFNIDGAAKGNEEKADDGGIC